MPNKYPWQPLSPLHKTHDHYLTTWIETMKKSSPSLQSQQVWGRIVSTGSNFVVTGYNVHGEWVRIPCHNVTTARLYLGRVMTQFDFEIHSLDVKKGC